MEYEKFFKVSLYSHFFKLTGLSIRGKQLANQFAHRFIQYAPVRQPNGKYKYAPFKVFAASNLSRTEFRFHINTYEDFRRFLKDNYVRDEFCVFDKVPLPPSRDIDIKLNTEINLRDYQEPASEYLIKDDHVSKLLEFRTGRGKGICSVAATVKIAKRVVMVIKPAYIDKWIPEIQAYLLEPSESIMSIAGGDQLRGLIQLALDKKLEAKFIIISNKTLQNFITSYENDPTFFRDEYGLNYPEDLFKVMEVGVRIIDEVHQDSHFNFKLDLYTNIYKTISLSATLVSHNEFLMKMFEIMYPKLKRYNETFVNKYIDTYAVMYDIKYGYKLRTSEYGQTTYSHIAFEDSIMKSTKLLNDYMELIADTVNRSYIKDYVKGDKCIVFASSILMCTHITAYLQKKFNHLDVRRYVEKDPYENVIDSDIRVTTVLSAGTALDIKNLTTNIMTMALSSLQANIQTLGRLREIKGRLTRFYYFVCNNIPKHKEYHYAKKEIFLPLVKSSSEIFYNKIVG